MKAKKRNTRLSLIMAAALAITASLSSMPVLASESETVDNKNSDYVDTVSFAIKDDLVDLSPWKQMNNGRELVATLVYETLLTGDMEPCLAESYEQVDDHTYIFYLYDYIYDTEGNHLTASDVVYSVDSCLAIGENPAVCNTVVSAEAIDDYTVQLNLVETVGIGDFESAIFNLMITTQAAYEASEDGMVTTPVGTSHYTVTEFIKSSSCTLEDTQDYWQTDELTAACSVANTKTIVAHIITDSSQRTIALQNDTVDYAAVAYTDRNTFLEKEGYTVSDVMIGSAFLLIPNCSESSIMNNELLREAVFYAIDNAGVATGYTTAVASPLYAIGSSVYSDYYADYFETEAETNYYNYDPDKALELISEAGYSASDININLVCQSSQDGQDCAQIMQAYLMAIGINCSITSYDSAIINDYLEDDTTWDLYVAQYRGDESWLNITEKIFNPEKFSSGGTFNFIFDDELQELMNTARSVDGHTEENVKAFHDYIVENAYVKGVLVAMTTNVLTSVFDADGIVYQDISPTQINVGASVYNAE